MSNYNLIQIVKDGFDEFNQEFIVMLLNSVKDYFENIGIKSEKQVIVKYFDNGPMCCNTREVNIHEVLLNANDETGCQWVYQFAHEFCHHLIDGKLTGETRGLKWLEESLCHVSSYVCLDNYARICASTPLLYDKVEIVIRYLRNLLVEDETPLYVAYMPDINNPLKTEKIPNDRFIHLQTFLEENASKLASIYSMNEYKKIARALFPHFYNNPKLWRIIPKLGDTMEWTSLLELFDFLLNNKNAIEEYKTSLVEMKAYLL